MPSQAASERTLRAVLRYMVDPRGVRDVEKSTEDLQMQLSELRSSFFDLMEPVQDIGMIASQFEGIGFEIQDYGRRITDTFSQYAEEYIDFAEGATKTSEEWLETTAKLEESQRRFGGVAAQSMLPMMKLQAQIVEQATAFAEKYPEIAQIAFGIGTAVILASSLANAVAKGIRLVADVKLIALEAQRVLAARMMRDAANKQIEAAALMSLSAKEGRVMGVLEGAKIGDDESIKIAGRLKTFVTDAGKDMTKEAGKMSKAGGIATKSLATLKGGISALSAAVMANITIIAGAAAVASVVAMGIAIKNFADDVEEGQQKVEDAWTKRLDKSVESTESAVAVVDEYRAAQDRVAKAHDEGGLVADLFVKKSRVMHASVKEVREAIEKGSRSYEDYEQAIRKYNDTLDETERPLRIVSEETYQFRREAQRLSKELREGRASLIEYSRLLMEQGNIFEQIAGVTLYGIALTQQEVALKDLLDDWVQYNEEIDRLSEEFGTERTAAWDEFNETMEALDEETTSERERIMREYDMAVVKLEADTATDRERIAQESGDDLAQIEERIGLQREQAMTSFVREMDEAEDEYYKERAERAAEFGIEVLRAEQDHQRDMRRMREDSEGRQRDAIRSRDAIALLEERRSYEQDRSRADEDFRVDIARRHEDFARQMQQMEASFKEQQAARAAAYAEQIAELDKQLREEQKIREDAAAEEAELLEESRNVQNRELYDSKEEELDTLETENDKQEGENKKSLNTRLRDAQNSYRTGIDANRRQLDQRLKDQGFWNSKELSEYERFRDQSLTTLRNFVTQSNIALQGLNIPSATPTGFNASGGYADFGLYRMGEEGTEYVLDNQTTRAAEQMIGGNLSQEGILAGLAGSGGRPTLNQNFTFVGSLSGQEKEEYKRIAYEQSLRAVNDVIDEVN